MTEETSVRMTSTSKPADLDFNKLLNGTLRVFFKDAVRSALSNPSQAVFFVKTLTGRNMLLGLERTGRSRGCTFRLFSSSA